MTMQNNFNRKDNRKKGRFGEEEAKEYLQNEGYYILDQNYQVRDGEIDIIARDDEYLIFVEVKARNKMDYGRPMEAVTKSKQKKIIKTAEYYLYEHQNLNYQPRFDVIEVNFSTNKIKHIKNAFWIGD